MWDPEAEWLFSGSFDASVVCWNIGAHQGIALELNGHSDRLIGITFDKSRKLLITCSADGHIGTWPMNVKRCETPKWLESDNCQICHLPFFWNVRAMWSQKQIGLRQVSRKLIELAFDSISFCYDFSIIAESVVALFAISVHKLEKHFHS